MLVYWRGFGGLLRREVVALRRRPFDCLLPLFFFALVCMLFAVAAGAQTRLLAQFAPAVAWSAALLAALLPHEKIFLPDYENGFMELALASGQPLPLFALAKSCAHWLQTGLPLLFAAPIAALMLGLPASALWALALTLPPASAALSLLAVLAAALTVGQRGSLLAALLALPLALPLLVFAVAAADFAAAGRSPAGAAALLWALCALALTFLPLASAGALRAVGGAR